MVQYSYNMPIAQAGQIADTSLRDIISKTTTAIIEFGVPVKRDPANPTTLVLPWADAITTRFLGITVLSILEVTGNYQPQSAVSVLTFGRIWINVKNGVAIAPYDPAYLEATTGSFTNVATGNLLIGQFVTGGIGGIDLIQLEIR